VRQEKTVRGVLVHQQRAPRHQPGSPAAAELERRLDVVVAMNDQRRNGDGLELVAEIAGEAGQKKAVPPSI
jgi:hypothetical protein